MPKNTNIAIVILTWNGLEFTRKCFESLNLASLPKWVKVIVVDNGSTDGTLEFLRTLKNIQLIENKQNLGYSRAVNIGINAANSEADIILLNNDVELIEPDWLPRFKTVAEMHANLGIIGVKILREDGTLQHCGAYLPVDTCWGQQVAAAEVDIGQYSGVYECESVVFACVYIKREVFNKIGLLSEDYFAYFEDTDFCHRAKKAGILTGVCGDIKIKHAESSTTKENGVSHISLFQKSQKTFISKWGASLKKDRYSEGAVDWHSVVNTPSGYAVSSRNLMETLDKAGVFVAYKYVYGEGTAVPMPENKYSDSYMINVMSNREFGQAPVQVVYGLGDVFKRNTGAYKIGYTMLEVNGLPEEWVKQANQMNEIWVPSSFNKQTFAEAGIKKPIKVIPLGVDPAYFSPKIKGKKDNKCFTFLSIFEWGERKAPDILLRAFADEFSIKEPVRLLCKINNFDGSVNVRKNIVNLNLRKNGGRVFIAENQILKHYELGVLYRSVDSFVLPTRGEGWGMPILEAMACGLPVIATNWSAQTDFMNKDNSFPLEVESLVPAIAKCPYYKGFDWAEPSYEHLRYLMRWIYENQKKAQLIGMQAAVDVENHWTWEQAIKKMLPCFHDVGQENFFLTT